MSSLFERWVTKNNIAGTNGLGPGQAAFSVYYCSHCVCVCGGGAGCLVLVHTRTRKFCQSGSNSTLHSFFSRIIFLMLGEGFK